MSKRALVAPMALFLAISGTGVAVAFPTTPLNPAVPASAYVTPVHGEVLRKFKRPDKHTHRHCHIIVEGDEVHKPCHSHSHDKDGDHHGGRYHREN